ncbi:MAG: alpha/beta hydrolase [Actinomycetota bacterium]|nr:alpha/beta hydrolase [Actinomycetota bacterium]
MPSFVGDATTIYYEDTGGDGAPVLFSHGILMDHEMFDPQIEALANEFRCITWDQRGHGETTTEGSWSYWNSANDALRLLEHLDIEHAFFTGMSQGGFLSLRAALTAPDRVDGLALIDTQAGPEDPAVTPSYDAFLAAWTTEPTHDLAETVAAIILGPAPHEPWIEKWLARDPEAMREPYATLTSREDIHDRLPEIECPALVIHGEADPAISMDKAEALCTGLPRCEGLVRIPEAGHAANLSHPGVVTEALRDFFRRHAG